jgi:hypothetical protein
VPRPGISSVHIGGMQIARDIEEPYLIDVLAVALVFDGDAPGRRLDRDTAFFLRHHEALFDRHRHRADRAVAAHRQATADLDEKDADVAVVA